MKKFNTEKESFSDEYRLRAHHQMSFNDVIIENLSSSIVTWFPCTLENPITILDLCCGHGKPTYDLLKKLDEKGVFVLKIVGYDIAEAQINTARINYDLESRLDFQVCDVEKIQDTNKYDLVISLFGLHWMESIENTAMLIYTSLKPDGKIMFFVPLEKMDLFKLRKDFICESEYSKFFNEYTINPFIEKENEYILAFDKYFKHEDSFTKTGNKEIFYTKDQFATFLSSWLPEMRYLSSLKINCSEYPYQLVDSIEENSNENIKIMEDDAILFTEHFFSYQGSIKDELIQKKYNQMNFEYKQDFIGVVDVYDES